MILVPVSGDQQVRARLLSTDRRWKSALDAKDLRHAVREIRIDIDLCAGRSLEHKPGAAQPPGHHVASGTCIWAIVCANEAIGYPFDPSWRCCSSEISICTSGRCSISSRSAVPKPGRSGKLSMPSEIGIRSVITSLYQPS